MFPCLHACYHIVTYGVDTIDIASTNDAPNEAEVPLEQNDNNDILPKFLRSVLAEVQS